MKYLFIFILFFQLSILASQDCLPQGISFKTQQEVNDFKKNYPDCSRILGDVRIGEDSNDPPWYFDSLSNVKNFGNNFIVYQADLMRDFRGLQNLENIVGILDLSYAGSILNITGLEGLQSVGGIIMKGNGVRNFNGLQNLKEITGTLNVEDSEIRNFNNLNSLEQIGGDFTIINNQTIRNFEGLEQLEIIAGNFNLENTSIINLQGLESLEEIGNNFYLFQNFSLDNFEGANQLTGIGGSLLVNQSENLKSTKGFPRLESIGRDFELILNFITDTAEDLEGFDVLKSIGGDFYTDDLFFNLNGMQSLEFVGGNFQLYGTWNGYDTLRAFSSLKEVGNDFHIEVDGANSFIGFRSLEKVSGAFKLIANDNLGSLLPFRKVDFNKSEYVELDYNRKLAICDTRNICEYLLFNDTPNYKFINNAMGCSNENEVISLCKEQLSKVDIQVFYDQNENQIKEPDEPLIPNAQINIQPLDLTTISLQDSTFSVSLFYGNHEISFDNSSLKNWELTTAPSSNIELLESNFCDSVSFGIIPKDSILDITTSLTFPQARCNEEVIISPNIHNQGTTIPSGILWIEIDSLIDETQFISPPDSILDPFTFGWNFSELLPNYSSLKE